MGPPLNRKRTAIEGARLAAQIAGVLPELGWSVCEPLLVPLLQDLHVPTHWLSIGWLLSPVAGIVLQPLVGSLSDQYGRKPFVVFFTGTASIGLAMIAFSTFLPTSVAKYAAILAFSMTDLSHDLLVTPIKAAMNDVFDADIAEQHSAVAAGVGKVLALLCATFFSIHLALLSTAVIMMLGCLSQVALLPPSSVAISTLLAHQTSAGTATGANPSNQGTETGDMSERADAKETSFLGALGHVPTGFWLMWLMQFAGWLGIMTFYFYFTSACAELAGALPNTRRFEREVHRGSAYMIINSFVFVPIGVKLPAIVAKCGGAMPAMLMSCLCLSITLISFSTTPRIIAMMFSIFLTPLAYQVVANTPFAWLEVQPGFDESSRGRYTGWFNSAMAAAQVCTAVLSGPLIEAFGGRIILAYSVAGLINAAVFMWGTCRVITRRRPLVKKAKPGVTVVRLE